MRLIRNLLITSGRIVLINQLLNNDGIDVEQLLAFLSDAIYLIDGFMGRQMKNLKILVPALQPCKEL
jgi:hypothetical protein